MAEEAYLSLEGLTKSYDGRQTAVAGISLAIARGEFVSLLGPSGSGKTTTLMMIAGFEQPTAGTIRLRGRSLEDVPAFRRNIGVVFQNYALFPHMTVERNVAFPLRIRKLPAAERAARARRALDMVGLAGFAERRPRELSGGQQQRVALARALVFEPDVLLLDEPLGALDKNLREQMQIEIKRLHRQLGITTVYVTHDQSEAMTLSDRMVIFSQGVIEQAGPPLEVYHRPRTNFVARFVGDCNILPGRILDGETGTVELEGLGRVATGRPIAGGAAGRPVEVVLRPEFIRLAAAGPEEDVRFELAVESIMNYGESAVVFGTAGATAVRARVIGRDVAGLAAGGRAAAAVRAADFWVLPPQ
ncbi:MAG: ABC transporter ATP-binding protein [Alphaproteobacteria bacterium]